MTISIPWYVGIISARIFVCTQKSLIIFIYKSYIKAGILESKIKKSNAREKRIDLYWH